jgi:hypothetical protein
MHLVGFITEIYYNARTCERQILNDSFLAIYEWVIYATCMSVDIVRARRLV